MPSNIPSASAAPVPASGPSNAAQPSGLRQMALKASFAGALQSEADEKYDEVLGAGGDGLGASGLFELNALTNIMVTATEAFTSTTSAYRKNLKEITGHLG